eukprot:TRINITY_DN13707_c0_g1_i1.p1 TRINITY_DN13707_c0_g1~~TRINITY_DN13707_c0_g1_i1.p1  ORF type:complete len:539 (+),score=77.94 TRINITY_DN13707_c0_g1_i1:38-1654(+)
MPRLPILRKLGSGLSQDGLSPTAVIPVDQSPNRGKQGSPQHGQTPKSCKHMLLSDLSPTSSKQGSPWSGRQRPNVKFFIEDQSSIVPSDDATAMVELPLPGSYQTQVSPALPTKDSGESVQKRMIGIKSSTASHRDQEMNKLGQYDGLENLGQGLATAACVSDDATQVKQLDPPGSCQERVDKDRSVVKPVPPKNKSGKMLSKRRPGMKLTIACPTYRDQEAFQKAGSSWAEQFDLHEQLGQGSTGVVRRAIRKADNLEVAVKVMQALDEEMVCIRREEFKLLQRIKHPHIVKAVDFFASQDQAVLVLEYFPSKTLDDAVQIAPEHRLPESTSKVLSKMLFLAIECLHQHRIVHRDVKSANILVSHDLSNLCLVDFNAARCMLEGGSLTMTGTKQYLAPEVLQGESPSESCDVWSAGLCLHMMLAGYLPWQNHENRSQASYAKGILSKPLCLDGAPWKTISHECQGFIKLCLNLDKNLRPTPTTLLQHAWLLGFKGERRLRSKTLQRAKFSTYAPSSAQAVAHVSSKGELFKSRTQDF